MFGRSAVNSMRVTFSKEVSKAVMVLFASQLQLIDAARGPHLWADRFDRKLGDTFSIQDEIARMISSSLAIHINDAEAHRPLAKPTASWEAYDYFLRGNYMLNRLLTGVPVEELYKARKLLERSIELDPTFARPYAALATSHSVAWINPVNQEYQTKETLQRVFELAQKAVELVSNEAFGHRVLANAAMFRRDGAACLAAWDRVFALNPNYCDWRYGLMPGAVGRTGGGAGRDTTHMRLDPFFPPHALMVEGPAAFAFERRYQQALLSVSRNDRSSARTFATDASCWRRPMRTWENTRSPAPGQRVAQEQAGLLKKLSGNTIFIPPKMFFITLMDCTRQASLKNDLLLRPVFRRLRSLPVGWNRMTAFGRFRTSALIPEFWPLG